MRVSLYVSYYYDSSYYDDEINDSIPSLLIIGVAVSLIYLSKLSLLLLLLVSFILIKLYSLLLLLFV